MNNPFVVILTTSAAYIQSNEKVEDAYINCIWTVSHITKICFILESIIYCTVKILRRIGSCEDQASRSLPTKNG